MKVVMMIAAVAAFTISKDSSPVTKVLNLLTDMQNELAAEKKSDEEMYDKMSCWCKKNGNNKDSAVATATSSIESLESEIKAKTAKASQLEMDIKQLDEEVASNMQSLSAAEKLRQEQAAQFHQDDKDMTLSIDSLKNALVVMAKSQESSFMQTTSTTTVRHTLRKIVKDAGEDLMNQVLGPSEKNVLTDFLQSTAQPGGAHAPASGEIMGVLKQMKENFESNLADATAADAKAKAEFAELKKGKTDEITSGEELAKDKTSSLSKTRQGLADAKEDLEDTSNALSADQTFLADMAKRCGQADADWEERSKTRTLEISAVSEAINIISGGDTHDLFKSTLGFLQMQSTRRVMSKSDRARQSASRILLKAAEKSGNKALVQVAAMAKLDAFKQVEDSIKGMIADLEKESADEVALKDFCRDAFHKNDMATMKEEDHIKDLTTQINDFAASIESIAGEIAVLKAEIDDTTVALQQANMNRVKENQEFQKTVADQRATQVILKKAVDKLANFYEFYQTKTAVKVEQTPGAAAPPPPAAMEEYKSNAGAGSVLTMIRNIIQDAVEMETEAITSEQDAQSSYEEFAANSFASIEEAQRAITNKVESKAQAEEGKVSTDADLKDATASLEALHREDAELHQQCDFVVTNFEAREASRVAESDGLKNALAALSQGAASLP